MAEDELNEVMDDVQMGIDTLLMCARARALRCRTAASSSERAQLAGRACAVVRGVACCLPVVYAVLAAKYGALSVDHIEYLVDSDIPSLVKSETVAVLLPGAFYYLSEVYLLVF